MYFTSCLPDILCRMSIDSIEVSNVMLPSGLTSVTRHALVEMLVMSAVWEVPEIVVSIFDCCTTFERTVSPLAKR